MLVLFKHQRVSLGYVKVSFVNFESVQFFLLEWMVSIPASLKKSVYQAKVTIQYSCKVKNYTFSCKKDSDKIDVPGRI